MKQVKNISFEDVALSRDVTPEKYYGVIRDSIKGFIKQNSFTDPCVRAFSVSGFSRSNSWPNTERNSFRECIEILIRQGNIVYEFDTPQELFGWLSQQGW